METTNIKIIGHNADGDMFSWTETTVEGSRNFEQYESSVTAASGTTYGITLVREVA
jgi:hypothetical protein